MPVLGRPSRVPVPSELSCPHTCTIQPLQAPFYPRSAVPLQEHGAIPASLKTNAQSSLPHCINCHGQSAAAPSHSRPHTLTACFTHMVRPSVHASALQHAPDQSQASAAVCMIVGLGPPPAFFGVSMCVAKWVQAPSSLPAAAVTPTHALAQERGA